MHDQPKQEQFNNWPKLNPNNFVPSTVNQQARKRKQREAKKKTKKS